MVGYGSVDLVLVPGVDLILFVEEDLVADRELADAQGDVAVGVVDAGVQLGVGRRVGGVAPHAARSWIGGRCCGRPAVGMLPLRYSRWALRAGRSGQGELADGCAARYPVLHDRQNRGRLDRGYGGKLGNLGVRHIDLLPVRPGLSSVARGSIPKTC